MKKFFLIPLLTLMCSVMAWGAEVGTFTELQNALAGSDATITLTDDITITGTGNMYSPNLSITKRTVTIDLAGHTLTDDGHYISVGSKGDVTVKNGYIRVASVYSFAANIGGKLKFENVKKVADQAPNVGTLMYDDGIVVRIEPMHVWQQGTGTLTLDSDCDLNIIGKSVGGIANGGSCTIYYMSKITTDNSVKAYLDTLNATKKRIVPPTIDPSVYDNYDSYFDQDVKERMFLTLTGNGNGTEIYKLKTTSDKGECKFVRGEKTYYFKDLASAMKYSTNEYPYKLQGDTSLATLNLVGYLDLNGKTLTLTQDGSSIVTVKNGQLTIRNSQPATGGIDITGTGKENGYAFDITPSSKSKANYSVLTIEKDVTINMPNWKGYFLGVPYDKGYGTVLNMNGTVKVPNGAGITLNGNMQAVDPNAPIFNIGGTINAKSIGIYAAGYGVWNISDGAQIIGHTGIAIKGGTLNISGGTIHAVGNNGGRVEGYNNGINSSFAAVQIESNPGYAGNMNITVSDNATLISDSWYVFYEYLSNPDAATKVKSIAVTGGKFQGGILISQSLAAKGGFVSGGKWTKDISANIKTGENLSLLNNEDDDNPPYLYLVGVPTTAQEEDYAEIKNLPNTTDPTQNNNAVLTNSASESAVQSYTSDNVGTNTDDIDVIPTKETNPVVVSENTDVVATEAAPIVEVKKVTVDNDAQLTVTEGATLMVGAGAVTLDENSSNGLTVEAGAALVVEGLVYGSTEENFVIKGQEDKSAIVLFSPETEFIKEDHPTATYRFTSKSFRDGSKWVYQRFGMPSFDGTVTVKSGNLEKNSYICTWDYATDDWGAWSEKIPADGLVYAGAEKAVPFQCYQLGSTNAKDAPITYDFVVELMGNANAPLNFKAGWNPYANSYTAPIDIKEFLTDVIANTSADIQATIYLYKDLGNDTYTWQGINLGNVGKTYRVRENGAMVKKTYDASIEPMQAFIMKLSSGDDATQDINYLNNVYNPAMGIDRPASAPARNHTSYNEMQIGVFNDMYWDNISVMEGEQFSADLDNGYDACKYDHNRGLSLYVINGATRMERIAIDNAEGLMVGIDAPVAGQYTLDFSNVNGEEFAIIDMTNNAVINIVEDGEYSFYATAGKNDYRFQIVKAAKMPTAIENIEASAAVKGIYTITGQFLGYDFNRVPAGVYVVNGVKVVK